MVNEVSSQGLDALLAEHLKGVIMSRLVTHYYCIFFLLLTAFLLAGCTSSEIPGSTISPSAIATLLPNPVELATPTNVAPSVSPTPNSLTSGPFKMVLPIDAITTDTVESLISTSNGSLWLITREMIIRILENEPEVYLSDYPGKFVGLDDLGRVWVVSEDTSEISAWDGKTRTTFGADNGWTPLNENSFWQVYNGVGDIDGGFWLPTSQDVRYFDGKNWVVFSRQELGMEPPVYEDLMPRFMVKVAKSGTVWVGECDWGGPGPFGGGGLRWLEDGTWQGVTSPAASGCVNAYIEDQLGRVWVGIDSNLWRYDPASGDWLEFGTPPTPIKDTRFGYFVSLALDPDEEIWPVLDLCGGASCYGSSVLYHLRDAQWNQVGEVAEYDDRHWGPIFDNAGTGWLGWQGGIYRIKNDTPELVSPIAGRFGTVDGIGRIWFVAELEGKETLWVMNEE